MVANFLISEAVNIRERSGRKGDMKNQKSFPCHLCCGGAINSRTVHLPENHRAALG
jgi:hypothetical protein